MDALERARTVAPVLEAGSAEGERLRRLPDATLAALHEAGLFRLLLPRALDGTEVDPVTYLGAIEVLAAADASAAWCVGQASGCAMSAAYLAPDVAREVFGDPRAVLAWGAGVEGRATVVDGGYRVTGTWRFASGCRHATWLGGHCLILGADGAPLRRADGAAENRTVLFRPGDASLLDVWRVVGLKATGSDTISVRDLFVPRERALARDEPAERRQPGPLYCLSSGNMYASGFAALALAVARRMLDDFVALAQGKVARGASATLRESAVVQAEVARCEARLRAARGFLVGSLVEIWRDVERTARTLSLADRATIRLAATHAIREAVAVADTVYSAAGATAIFEDDGFERRFRDIHTAAQQVQGRATHFETVGRFLLGLAPDQTFL